MNFYRSKTVATWLALLGGTLGLHRFYLRGLGDLPGWLHPLPTMLGALGAWRMRQFGVDDPLGNLLVPLLGLMISVAMLAAILFGLTPDEKWEARYNPQALARTTRWGPVLGVILALMLGATALMSTVAFSAQRLFEWQAHQTDQNQSAGAQNTMRPTQ